MARKPTYNIGAGTQVTLICKICGIDFVRSIMKKKAKFCSIDCSIQNLRKPEIIAKRAKTTTGLKRLKTNHKRKTFTKIRECVKCRVNLISYYSTSGQCRCCAKIKHTQQNTCLDCGKEIRQKSVYCIKHCKTGSRSSNYIQDRTLVARTDERSNPCYKEWRINVYKRDNYMCKLKNNECDGRIEAHHILPWRDFENLRYEVNNGITLCAFHHPRRKEKEYQMVPYFTSIINSSWAQES